MRLGYQPPFDWASLSGFFRPRAIPGVEEVKSGIYHRSLRLDGKVGLLEVLIFDCCGHVAQSLFHDIAPALEMGLTTACNNRRHDKEGFGAIPPTQAQPDLELPDLTSLAKLAAAL